MQCKYSAFAKHLHLSVIHSVKEQCRSLRRRCGTVSFPLFRSLRQLRRRTIRPDPKPVNTFREKNLRKMPILFQNRNNKLKRKHLC
ncbi:hypothetical protein CV_3929 [Chromobacterium violaceum ATCC 12472]|uniref:Uncharacterized protein n=1 Tax=Chromobacterium violaceum (strain ATCC 12472 / DSM 30191 / JCM 1249 / CCUG 213 / NBRC 12614 / NCIMB 9131 / NCTC 9757 / MK) TaxID=243365 RepID=Q7NR55_CHRVO|nr:hypothetical protein CV_3929 [Chromobacterium violaceum ATCC 12472]